VKTRRENEQPSLFKLAPRVVEGIEVPAEQRELAHALPPRLRLGTMSWSFPGWRGVIYDEQASPKSFAEAGLTAYTKHPLLRTVEIDRSFYDPLPARYFAGVSEQVPDDFRFVVKAHEDCTLVRYPEHARYGSKQRQLSARYLDAAYATDAVVGPTCEGLGDKLGLLLFQFAPQDAGEPRAFADRLQAFLEALPRGVPYAVELRNVELLTRDYAQALNGNAVHALNVWGNMPSVLEQARLIPPAARKPLLIRWLMRRGDTYEGARSRFMPFSRLVEPDSASREAIATLLAKALAHEVPAFVVVNNKAEGCAPESIFELARSISKQGLQVGP
jgi:uncharacterized protein YecE (DUF72 family)